MNLIKQMKRRFPAPLTCMINPKQTFALSASHRTFTNVTTAVLPRLIAEQQGLDQYFNLKECPDYQNFHLVPPMNSPFFSNYSG